PRWFSWVLTIASHLLLAAIAFVGSWLFFPREVILVIDSLTGTVRQGHFSPDRNTIEVPGLPPIEVRRSDRPSPPALAPQPAQPARRSRIAAAREVPRIRKPKRIPMPPENNDKTIKITLDDLANVRGPEAGAIAATPVPAGTRVYGSINEPADPLTQVAEEKG